MLPGFGSLEKIGQISGGPAVSRTGSQYDYSSAVTTQGGLVMGNDAPTTFAVVAGVVALGGLVWWVARK